MNWIPTGRTLLFLLGVVALTDCSKPASDTTSQKVVQPLLSQEEAEKVVSEQFPVGRYVINDFIPKPGAPAPAALNPPQKLHLGLYWVENDELTPWYIAQEKGFFANVGISIDIDEGGPNRDMLTSLIANRIDMYIGPPENALFVITSQTGTDLKMICALMKETPNGWIGLDKSIPNSQTSTRVLGRDDLIGKRIAVTPGRGFMIDVACSELGIRPEDLHVMSAGATPDSLIGGAVDYYEGFRTNQPRILERNGYKNWTFFPFSKVGMKDYFDSSIVTAQFYKDNPQLLINYVYALNEAITYEIAHPDEAADIAVKYTPKYPVTKEEALWRIKQEIPLYQGDGSEPILAMKDSVIQHQVALLYRYRQIELPAAISH